MQLIKMASSMESEVEVDEAQGETSGSCSMSTTSGVGKKREELRCGCIFRRWKLEW